MNFLEYVTYEVEYEHINTTILCGTVINMTLIISKVNFGDIDDDNNSCHSYYT